MVGYDKFNGEDKVVELAREIKQSTDDEKIEEYADKIIGRQRGELDSIAEEMLEAANSKAIGTTPFEEFVDTDSMDVSTATSLVSKIREMGKEKYPDKRIKIHRSGSGDKPFITTEHDRFVSISVG